MSMRSRMDMYRSVVAQMLRSTGGTQRATAQSHERREQMRPAVGCPLDRRVMGVTEDEMYSTEQRDGLFVVLVTAVLLLAASEAVHSWRVVQLESRVTQLLSQQPEAQIAAPTESASAPAVRADHAEPVGLPRGVQNRVPTDASRK